MINTHTRKQALDTTRQRSNRKVDTRPLELHRDTMPRKDKSASKQETPLSVGSTEAGLGPMPRGKAY